MSRIKADALKARRKDQGMTQKQLAKIAGVSYSTLTKLEQGAIDSPSVTLVNDLASALGCQVQDLLEMEARQLVPSEDIDFIYFDVGGVLVNDISVSLHSFAEAIHRSDHAVKAIFHEYGEVGARGNMTVDDLKLLMFLRLGVSLSGEARRAALSHSWIDDMEPILPGHRLAADLSKHHKIGLLTNVFRGYYPDFFHRGLVPNLKYKAVVKSCDVGLVKPEEAMYDVATQAAQTEASRILLIDDSKVNVKAAKAFGWSAEHFDERKPEQSVGRIVQRYFSADTD